MPNDLTIRIADSDTVGYIPMSINIDGRSINLIVPPETKQVDPDTLADAVVAFLNAIGGHR